MIEQKDLILVQEYNSKKAEIIELDSEMAKLDEQKQALNDEKKAVKREISKIKTKLKKVDVTAIETAINEIKDIQAK